MTDRVLVEALRARDPGALAELYDSYAESLYRYCWTLLGAPDNAQVAVRDTMIAAEAHIGALADPERLRPWLYALARRECRHRRTPEPADAAEGVTEPAVPAVPPLDDPADADLRVVAWHATQGLGDADRELLDLATRHGLAAADIALVLGVDRTEAESLLAGATERLRDAITVEVLARKGPSDCPRRARLMAGYAGELTPETREQLIRHVGKCEICRPHRAGQVSAAKVFGLLPWVVLPDTVRVRVMSCFVDPELLPYRAFVARRLGPLDSTGFPAARGRKPRQWAQAVAGGIGAVAAAAAIMLGFVQFVQTDDRTTGVASASYSIGGESSVETPLPRQSEPESSAMIINSPSAPTSTSGPKPAPSRTARVPLPAPRPTPTVRKTFTHAPRPEPTAAPRTPPRSETPTAMPTATPSETLSEVPSASPSLIVVTPTQHYPAQRFTNADDHRRRPPCDRKS